VSVLALTIALVVGLCAAALVVIVASALIDMALPDEDDDA